MAFSRKQLVALRRDLNNKVVRTREADGRQLSYLEGWFVISEANRIFGFDGWSRETLDSRCVLARENRGSFLAVYIARVRVTVQANGASVVREGHGSGESRGMSAGAVHDVAVKAAETDATKRALATFGKPFGLELYRKPTIVEQAAPSIAPTADTQGRAGLHPDDTTPIPRPSRYYGQRQSAPVCDHFREERLVLEQEHPAASAAPPLAPAPSDLALGRIDKSVLAIHEPKRLRDKAHLKFVASQPCLVCGRQPCDPHHVRFAQPRAIGMKVSDEFTVPLCRGHHRQLHQAGNEVLWWETFKISPLAIANELWDQTHARPGVEIKS
jgi:DNA recombination protein Rad52